MVGLGLNPKRPDCRGFKRETVDGFLSRGGTITKIPYHEPKHDFVLGYRGVPWTEIAAVGQSGRKPSLDDYDNWTIFKQ
jgi:hypothetical protein